MRTITKILIMLSSYYLTQQSFVAVNYHSDHHGAFNNSNNQLTLDPTEELYPQFFYHFILTNDKFNIFKLLIDDNDTDLVGSSVKPAKLKRFKKLLFNISVTNNSNSNSKNDETAIKELSKWFMDLYYNNREVITANREKLLLGIFLVISQKPDDEIISDDLANIMLTLKVHHNCQNYGELNNLFINYLVNDLKDPVISSKFYFYIYMDAIYGSKYGLIYDVLLNNKTDRSLGNFIKGEPLLNKFRSFPASQSHLDLVNLTQNLKNTYCIRYYSYLKNAGADLKTLSQARNQIKQLNLQVERND